MTSKIFTAGIPSPPRDFLAVAGELALLSREVAEQVAQEAAERQLPPERIIAQKGLLGTVEVDIIETLVRPHQIVPGYEILSLIGRGGMGVVYRARQKSLNREVAIKTVLVNQLADPAAVQRFEQEAKPLVFPDH